MQGNQVRRRRAELGISQKNLSDVVEVSRQSLNAIESGRTVPSVAIALRLARALSTDVESLFSEAARESVEARLCARASGKAARVLLASVRDVWVAHPLGGGRAGVGSQSADGFVERALRGGTARVELARPMAVLRESLLISGCAPVLGVLCDRLDAGSGRFRWLSQANTPALRGLARGDVHLAGLHLPEAELASLPQVAARHLPTQKGAVYTVARWDAGLVLPAGNPARIRRVRDLGARGLRLVMREPGAGARAQLEALLLGAGLDPGELAARATIAHGHMEVAQAVALGASDAGFSLRSAALAYGLAFLPLVAERFDLVVPGDLGADTRVLRLLDALASGTMRRELTELGYDASAAADKVADLDLS
jgi:putative molybdopterin biosynthesis protein